MSLIIRTFDYWRKINRHNVRLLAIRAFVCVALAGTTADASAQNSFQDPPPESAIKAIPAHVGDIVQPFRHDGRDAAVMTPPGDIPLARKVGDSGRMMPVTYLKGRVSSQEGRYILGPGDKIDMKIRDLSAYDQRFDIRPDGYASIHPFGEFYIAGSDLAGLETWLEEKFRFYLKQPVITLSVPELRPALIYISGAVRRPGTYQFIRQGQNNSTIASELQEKMELTLTNVLKRAGGLTLFSDLRHIAVRHNETGIQDDYDLMDLLLKGDNRDIWLMPGDTVSVPAASAPMSPELFRLVCRSTFYGEKFPVIVLGAVEKQGEIQIDPNNNSLNAAVSLAGGFKSYSRESVVLVQRPTQQGSFSQFRIDRRKVNFELMAGDVVYVADSKLSSVRDGLQLLSQMTQPFFFVTGGMSNINNMVK